MDDPLERDVAAISRISAVPTILRTMCALTGLRFNVIARVTPDRWIACAVHDEMDYGVKVGGEFDVATTLCSEVRDSRRAIIIDHVSADPVYCDHHTPKMYRFESYVSVPIFRRSGEYFGTLCGLDPVPRTLRDGKTLAVLELFSELISFQLDAEEQQQSSRAELDAQREASMLREQFIAVLGHDVRNPLSSILTGTELVLRRTNDDTDRRVLDRVRASARRIAALVDDLCDLARGHLGGGFAVEVAEAHDLPGRLRQVVEEVRAAHPTRTIHCQFDTSMAVRCDTKRVEQLLSNLLANAVEHGAPGTPIEVSIAGSEPIFAIKVTNQGAPIPEDRKARLFEPYFRGGRSGRHNGLGLGLYIVSEIARAHDGKIEVASTAEQTSFTFTMPRQGPPAEPFIAASRKHMADRESLY